MIHHLRAFAFLAAVVLVVPGYSQPPLPPPEQPEGKFGLAEKPEPGVQVLEKGPVHEAFAQPGTDVRGKGMTAPKAPPARIAELPPETKPDGANVKWIPGYWMWDAEREDFIWVSGFWRNAPAGREWQPGEWKKDRDGNHAYTPGFWRPADQKSWRVDLPEPPKTVENGPSIPSDNPDALWIPGTWEFRNGQYVWRPGYWAHPNGDQVWQPGQYLVTPSGFCHVPGYWDYPLEERGLLFAPVCFTEPLWLTPGWVYRPRFAVEVGFGNGWGSGGFYNSLFIGPGWNNYYFGNYCAPVGAGTWLGVGNPLWSPVFGFGSPLLGLGGVGGYVPWYCGYRGYANPLWRHYCWLNRRNPNWARNVQNAYVARSLNVNRVNVNTASVNRTVAARSAVASAATTAARAANAQRAVNPELVRPAAQVARSVSAANVARAAPRPSTNIPSSSKTGVNPSDRLRVAEPPGARPGGTLAPARPNPPVQNPPINAGAANRTPNPGGVARDGDTPRLQPGIRPDAEPRGGVPRNVPDVAVGRPNTPTIRPDIPAGRPDSPAIRPTNPVARPDVDLGRPGRGLDLPQRGGQPEIDRTPRLQPVNPVVGGLPAAQPRQALPAVGGGLPNVNVPRVPNVPNVGGGGRGLPNIPNIGGVGVPNMPRIQGVPNVGGGRGGVPNIGGASGRGVGGIPAGGGPRVGGAPGGGAGARGGRR